MPKGKGKGTMGEHVYPDGTRVRKKWSQADDTQKRNAQGTVLSSRVRPASLSSINIYVTDPPLGVVNFASHWMYTVKFDDEAQPVDIPDYKLGKAPDADATKR